jgi:osmoprotectant transport system ATP-binding protein
MTIAENIATVPRLLRWPGHRIAARVDELLDVVGLDPSVYRGRHPKALSGGQRQRVGVARALAADPPIMLMDEPFGALDPISRERLQNEFLRLQEDLRKTIVFVTHDIDEAIKMGDRIAILGEHSAVQQYDSPEAILSAPANDFVREFIGAGASLRRLNLARIRDFSLAERPVARLDDARETVLAALRASDDDWLLLLDGSGRPARWVTESDVLRATGGLERAGLEVRAVVEPHATLAGALDAMLSSRVGGVVVVDGRGRYVGAVDMSVIMAATEAMRAAAREETGRLPARTAEPERVGGRR